MNDDDKMVKYIMLLCQKRQPRGQVKTQDVIERTKNEFTYYSLTES